MSNFLNDFIKMRQNLRATTGMPMVGGMPVPTQSKTVQVSKPTGENITLAYIIENQPPMNEVIQYFKNRISALEALEEEDSD
jgi:hypothetical protein